MPENIRTLNVIILQNIYNLSSPVGKAKIIGKLVIDKQQMSILPVSVKPFKCESVLIIFRIIYSVGVNIHYFKPQEMKPSNVCTQWMINTLKTLLHQGHLVENRHTHNRSLIKFHNIIKPSLTFLGHFYMAIPQLWHQQFSTAGLFQSGAKAFEPPADGKSLVPHASSSYCSLFMPTYAAIEGK